MFTNWLRDAELIPVLSEFAEAGYHGYIGRVRDALMAKWADEASNAEVGAMIRVAAQFHTWRQLAHRECLSDEHAAQIMTCAILGCVRRRADETRSNDDVDEI